MQHCFWLALCSASLCGAATADPASEHAAVQAEYAEELAGLARRAEAAGSADLAAAIRSWAEPLDPRKLYLVALPESFRSGSASAEPGSANTELSAEFLSLRRGQADRLFGLARRAIRQKRTSLAYQLVLEALRENPDHGDARRLLGYVNYEGAWRTRYEVRKMRSGYVWHPRFGWLLETSVPRYENGQRLFNGRWITVAEEARIRSDMRSSWTVETEHYTVRTNHSLEAGVALGMRLERLYAAWQQTFVRFYASQEEIDKLFEGRGLLRANDYRHLVIYFRNRDEYRRKLQGMIPPGIETTGIYLGDRRTAYFFAPDDVPAKDVDYSTLFHEATHQLFSESRPVVADIGRLANFWIVEGIACYFESFAEHQGYYTLGGAQAQRLQDARFRALDDNFHVPVAELAQYGMLQLQQDPRIATLYSESAGLTHFLVHYQGGQYRDALVAYLVAVYSGRATPTALAELTGVPFHVLDQQYRQFLEELPIDEKPVAKAAQ